MRCDENIERESYLKILLMESNTSPQREEIPKYEQSMTSSMHLFANKIIDKIQVKIQIQHASFGKVDDSKYNSYMRIAGKQPSGIFNLGEY